MSDLAIQVENLSKAYPRNRRYEKRAYGRG